ncbi:E3 ubiquitin-protein ligase At1g63170-like [Phragmites australis]|uniref:E3 ubiquitin-protein ligase At1g63170-like n=1 Tax=Phragmites australis TaxID=29695 RepID=UPI002D771FC9|nr:E3 ubiquitin-protein ligase At1g63170-like [Phragmites australis]XP_062222463.1 E3 ubiquitin-protein ligase At1g63170-like [Phragmites australis]XP_062222464.1 E3 ubiquitin-protein ligase At1g63170-like [Phragmites australis]XP_062222465.1 E3 ubiquitin-protein ligase At1g63170-like [Phragmites australis]XP_062222467.1 E3 ubiquitin-protein ligase At1g63170-like [Phragmites australis]XP_062222468.1 E3 ubiquitin-protein ligase At1g63170-like [Phragmites australis]
MATPRSPGPRGDALLDSAPLLGGGGRRRWGALRRPSLRGAARLLRRGGRRAMREPSLLVREAAAEQLEERQAGWAYSRPVLALDLLWNLAFILVSAVVLVLSLDESPSMPLRFWIAGYAAQCIVHMVCVAIEHRMRHGQRGGAPMPSDEESGSDASSSSSDDDDGERVSRGRSGDCVSIAKQLESTNTMFSFMWWIIGFYWVSVGGQVLTHDAPQLYWLCIVFLAFDVFFVVFCVALACIIGIAVCCCLPCIIAILYAVSDQEGASEDDIRQIPKYKFRRVETPEKQSVNVTGTSGGIMIECGTNQPIEKALAAEDAECCICLSAYDDGAELRELPCDHHFHCACIDKWLHINATCPLCKYNIQKNASSSGSEEV